MVKVETSTKEKPATKGVAKNIAKNSKGNGAAKESPAKKDTPIVGLLTVGLPEKPQPGMIILIPRAQIIVSYNDNPRGGKNEVKKTTPTEWVRSLGVNGQTTAVEAYVTDIKARGNNQFKLKLVEGFRRLYGFDEIMKGTIKDEAGVILKMAVWPGSDADKNLIAVQIVEKPVGPEGEAMLLLRQVSNNTHEQWSNYQKCVNLAKLEDDLGMSVVDIAKQVGMGRTAVHYYLRAGRDKKLLKGIEEGWLSLAAASKAAVLAQEEGEKQSAAEIAKVAQEKAAGEGKIKVTAKHVEAAATPTTKKRYSFAEECGNLVNMIQDEQSTVERQKKDVPFGKRFKGGLVDDIVQVMMDAQVQSHSAEEMAHALIMAANFQENPDGGGVS